MRTKMSPNTQVIDFQHLTENANSAQTLQSLLFDAYGVSLSSWRRSGSNFVTQEHDGLKISRVRGTWIVKDFSGATIGDTTGRGAWQLVKHAYGLSGQQAAEKLAKVSGVSLQLTQHTEGGYYQRDNDLIQPQAVKIYQPNNGEITKKYYESISYADWSTPYGQSILSFIQQKTGANDGFIKTHFRPIATFKKGEFSETYTAARPAYAVLTEGGNKRIFRPHLKSKGMDKMPLTYCGNYVFGFFNLPSKCSLIAIVGGEHDCTAFNAAFNRLGWYAVTKGSETGNLEPELLDILRGRSERIVTLFDNDRAGREGMDKQTKAHHLQGIDLANYLNDPTLFPSCTFENGINKTLNDICDIVQKMQNGADWLEKIINVELKQKTISQLLPYRSTFSSIWQIPFGQYLGDTEGGYFHLKQVIDLCKKLFLQAPTGSGKTYLVLQKLANDPAFLALLGVERIVFFAPTNAIGKQQAEKHRLPFVSSIETVNKSEISQSKTIVATYDQAHNFLNDNYLNDTLFIVDEAHELVNGFGYRADTMRNLLKLMQAAQRVLAITATPNRELIKQLQFNFAIATPTDATTAQNIDIQPILLKQGTAKDILKVIESRRDAAKVTVIHCDNVNNLRAFENVLTRKHGKDAVTLISSKFDNTYLENEHYQSLIQTGKISPTIRFVLCTKLLEAGVNFEFDAEIFDIHPKSTNGLLQMLARPRIDLAAGYNHRVKAFVYFNVAGLKKAKRANLDNRLNAFFTEGGKIDLPFETGTYLSAIKNGIKSARKACDFANNLAKGSDELMQRARHQNDLCIVKNDTTGDWETDILAILSQNEQRLQSILRGDIVAFLNEIKALNPYIQILEPNTISLKKDETTRQEIADIKTAAAERKTIIAEKLADNDTTHAVLTLAHAEAKDPQLKTQFAAALGRKPISDELKTAKNTLGWTTQQGEITEIAHQYLDLVETAQTVVYKNRVKPIKTDNIKTQLPKLLNHHDLVKGRLQRLGERLTAEQETLNRDNFATIFNGKVNLAIRQKVFEHKLTKRRTLSRWAMTDIYNQAIQEVKTELNLRKYTPYASFQTVKKRFEELFKVSICDKNTFAMGDEITAANVLQVPPQLAKFANSK